MRYGSVCSGIEAATTAWHPLGWDPAWFAEIEKFPSNVLRARWANVPNLGDMTKLHQEETFRGTAIDLLVGGTPCQSFSIAGLRKGLADPRGNLALHFLKILDEKRPEWVVWENVPGVLSSWSDDPDHPPIANCEGGARIVQRNDFDTFLFGLRELGYRGGWRILDAQHFGIPQRRRRVFVVANLRDGRLAQTVLFERHSLQGHTPPSRKTWEELTRGAEDGPRGGSEALAPSSGPGADLRVSLDTAQGRHLDPSLETFVTHTLRGVGFDASEYGTGRGTPLVPMAFNGAQDRCAGNQMFTLKPNMRREACVAFSENQRAEVTISDTMGALKTGGGKPGQGYPAIALLEVNARTGDSGIRSGAGMGISEPGAPMFTLQAKAQHGVEAGSGVRRITPLEAERLQGFPDGYTKIAGASDSARYTALGNSMAVPVMAWLGRRIEIVSKMNL